MKKLLTVFLVAATLIAAIVPAGTHAADPGRFSDVESGAKYFEAVEYCAARGIMAGTGEGRFSPELPLTRAMAVTILAAYDRADCAEYADAAFEDVASGRWYTGAVNWAAQEGVVCGTGGDRFSPERAVTREELAVIFRAYAEYKGLYNRFIESGADDCADADEVSAWAVEAVRWAEGYGVITSAAEAGGDPVVAPKQTATRAEAAVMMMNLDLAASAEKSFTIAGNDISQYRIVIPDGAVKKGELEYLLDGAKAFQGYINEAFGVTLPIVYDSETPTDFEIVIGRTSREADGLVTVDVDKAAPNGENDLHYTVDVQGSRLVMAGAVDGDMRRGSLYAMYDFCEDALGYHFYSDKYVLRDDVSTALPADYRLTGGPEYKSRTVYWARGWDEVYFNDEYYTCASLTHELPKWIDPKLDASSATPCLSDEENIKKVVDTIRNKITKKYHDTIYLCCGDNIDGYCKCADCVAAYREDATTAATLVRLANRVCDELREDFPDFKVKLMAYLYTSAPPKVTKLDKNIIVYYCPITACASHTFFDDDCKINRTIRKEAEGWAALASEMYVWDYSANFNYVNCPLPDFDVLLENARWLYDLGVTGVFNNAVTGKVADLGELRAFLLTRIYRDPHMTKAQYNKLMNGYLRAFYGPGWRAVREFIDIIEETSDSKHFICEARPSSMYDLDAVAQKAEHIRSLWQYAMEKADTADRRENVRRTRVSAEFLVQCALFKSMVTDGTDATRAEYYARNDELYNEMIATGVKWNEDVKEIPFTRTASPENWG